MSMNTFDESKVRRSTDGKFANKPHAESDIDLSAYGLDQGTINRINEGAETFEDEEALYYAFDGMLRLTDTHDGAAEDVAEKIADGMGIDYGELNPEIQERLVNQTESLRVDEASESAADNQWSRWMGDLPDSNLPVSVDLAEEFLKNADLAHGNSQAYMQHGELRVTVEAPNNSTMGVDVSEDATMGDLYRQVADYMYSFDADDEFNEFWSSEFGSRNQFTPSQFIDMLKEDEEFFHEMAGPLSRKASETAPPRYVIGVDPGLNSLGQAYMLE